MKTKNIFTEYIKSFDKDKQEIAQNLWENIEGVLDELGFDSAKREIVLSYGMPAIKIDKKVVAGVSVFKKHVGLFPFSGTTLSNFEKELKDFKTTKSGVHLTKDKILTKTLLKKIIKARLAE